MLYWSFMIVFSLLIGPCMGCDAPRALFPAKEGIPEYYVLKRTYGKRFQTWRTSGPFVNWVGLEYSGFCTDVFGLSGMEFLNSNLNLFIEHNCCDLLFYLLKKKKKPTHFPLNIFLEIFFQKSTILSLIFFNWVQLIRKHNQVKPIWIEKPAVCKAASPWKAFGEQLSRQPCKLELPEVTLVYTLSLSKIADRFGYQNLSYLACSQFGFAACSQEEKILERPNNATIFSF